MIRRFVYLLLFACLCMAFIPVQQPITDTNSKYKAVYLYNFSKYFDWPSDYKSGNFIIGLIGKPSLYNELATMASTKSIGSQKFEIKIFENLESVSRCHMLYVPSETNLPLAKVLGKIKGQSTLLITEKEGYAKQGATINFVVQNNKVKFELNKSTINKYELKVSSSLESLAILVD